MDSGGYLRVPWHLCAVPFRNVRLSTLRCAGVVVLMASASISSIILGRIFLKDAITANATVSAALAIAGIAVIFGADLQGAALASMAGCGYGGLFGCPFSRACRRSGRMRLPTHSSVGRVAQLLKLKLLGSTGFEGCTLFIQIPINTLEVGDFLFDFCHLLFN